MADEKRLIDANMLKANFVVLGEFAKDLWHAGTIRSAIDNAPAVDAVEVVRCRECKSYEAGYVRQDHGWCTEWGTAVRASGFCHHGERRTDG